MFPEDMTEEELMAVLAAMQLEGDPMAASMNDYGQGAGYLDLPKKPSEFSRQGDMHQIYRNLFGMADIDMAELVPDLWPTVEPPPSGEYQSDSMPLYAGNPAYEAVGTLVQEGMPFEDALAEVWGREIEGKPLDLQTGAPDPEAFRTGAAAYVQEAGKVGRMDDQAARYEDFTRERSGLDFIPEAAEADPLAMYAQVRRRQRQLNPTPRDKIVGWGQGARMDSAPQPEDDWGPDSPGFNLGVAAQPSVRSDRSAGRVQRRDRDRRRRTQERASGSDFDYAGALERDKSAAAQYEATVRNRQQMLANHRVQSKEAENRARIIRFYNQLIKQGG